LKWNNYYVLGINMADKRLKSIRSYFDTTGIHLNNDEKDLLCNVINNQDRYDGFESSVYEEHASGKDYNGRWESSTKTQYKINIDENDFTVDEHYDHQCDDGYENKQDYKLTGVRDVLRALRNMGDEL